MDCCDKVREILMWKSAEETENFFPIRPECQDGVPKARFKPRAGKTLSARKWHSAFSEEGHLDIAKVLSRIQRGGVHPSIKGVVWEFLLGCYDPNSTFDERNQLRQRRREQYGEWKAECHKMVPTIGSGNIITIPIIGDDGQPIENDGSGFNEPSSLETNAPRDERVIQWKLLLHQIGLDVVRTDRALMFYFQNSENDAKLWNILSVYGWINDDIGYCQGMNDLCSPMVVLLENEADAFWCFERLMRRMEPSRKLTIITNEQHSERMEEPIGVLQETQEIEIMLNKQGSVVGGINEGLVDCSDSIRQKGDTSLNSTVLLQQEESHVGVVSGIEMRIHQKGIKPQSGNLQDKEQRNQLLDSASDKLKGNFRCTATSVGVQSQLGSLAAIIKALDPKLHQHLENLDGGEYLFAFRMLMVLFRREFSFIDSMYLWELMWAMEYNPNIFSVYEETSATGDVSATAKVNDKLLKRYGKFERKNVKSGVTDQQISGLSIFLVASVLENKNKKLLKEAKGLDDVVKILNDMTGNLDAKKACNEALKLHKKYLNKTKKE